MTKSRASSFTNITSLFAFSVLIGIGIFASAVDARAQHRPMDVPESVAPAPARQRLYLKDGSYQIIFSYKIIGDRVRYTTERDGVADEMPVALIDLAATQKWAHDHDPVVRAEQRSAAPVLTPELQKEEAARTARSPEVAPDLHLPEEDSVVVLDNFHGTPELVPLAQQGGDLNHETAHNVLKGAINPASSPHRILDVPGLKSDIQLHVPDPTFFVRVGADEADDAATGGAIVVDTHGASGRATPSGGDPKNGYVIERLDVRRDTREIDSFRIRDLGVKPQRDVIELAATTLPGGKWMKLIPSQPLEFGEYALIEVLSEREVNLGVWDFGVHPTAPDNIEAIHPEPKRPLTLERRRPQ